MSYALTLTQVSMLQSNRNAVSSPLPSDFRSNHFQVIFQNRKENTTKKLSLSRNLGKWNAKRTKMENVSGRDVE